MIEFRKVLAKYYKKWHQDCLDSIKFCEDKGRPEDAAEYARDAERFAKIIRENEKAIEFFSIGDNAFLKDSALPKEFQGYE